MVTTNVLQENAHKLAFLVQQYPEHNLEKLMDLLEMPPIEINTAIWQATDLGLISEPDKDEGAVRFLKEPELWQFGQNVIGLQSMLRYAMHKLAEREADMEENYMSNWTLGYTAHDVLVAMKHLIVTGELAQYTVEDDKQGDGSKYTFFCLAENRDKEWGRRQFEEEPTAKAEDGDTKEKTEE